MINKNLEDVISTSTNNSSVMLNMTGGKDACLIPVIPTAVEIERRKQSKEIQTQSFTAISTAMSIFIPLLALGGASVFVSSIALKIVINVVMVLSIILGIASTRIIEKKRKEKKPLKSSNDLSTEILSIEKKKNSIPLFFNSYINNEKSEALSFQSRFITAITYIDKQGMIDQYPEIAHIYNLFIKDYKSLNKLIDDGEDTISDIIKISRPNEFCYDNIVDEIIKELSVDEKSDDDGFFKRSMRKLASVYNLKNFNNLDRFIPRVDVIDNSDKAVSVLDSIVINLKNNDDKYLELLRDEVIRIREQEEVIFKDRINRLRFERETMF